MCDHHIDPKVVESSSTSCLLPNSSEYAVVSCSFFNGASLANRGGKKRIVDAESTTLKQKQDEFLVLGSESVKRGPYGSDNSF